MHASVTPTTASREIVFLRPTLTPKRLLPALRRRDTNQKTDSDLNRQLFTSNFRRNIHVLAFRRNLWPRSIALSAHLKHKPVSRRDRLDLFITLVVAINESPRDIRIRLTGRFLGRIHLVSIPIFPWPEGRSLVVLQLDNQQPHLLDARRANDSIRR